ncbi:MAG TPA: hypothetical protein VMG10_19440 [Gemmataceae bacterium]|nr:hypothetical protein [Gemmataceae bacterium]
MLWHGWLWEHRRWVRVTGPHPSLAECSQALERIGKGRHVPGKHQVMTTGAPPRFTPTGKRAVERSAKEGRRDDA